jgi:hypothetical protein
MACDSANQANARSEPLNETSAVCAARVSGEENTLLASRKSCERQKENETKMKLYLSWSCFPRFIETLRLLHTSCVEAVISVHHCLQVMLRLRFVPFAFTCTRSISPAITCTSTRTRYRGE